MIQDSAAGFRLPGWPRRTAVGLALVAVLAATGCTTHSKASERVVRTPTAQTTVAPGRQTPPPWDAPGGALRYMQAAGLPALTQEALEVHYHAHLDILVNGQSVTVPGSIGIDDQAQRISPVHTHDPSGIIHIEAPAPHAFTLGQFFIEWNVRLSAKCLGSLCSGNGKSLRLYVGGKPGPTDPATLILAPHQEIVLVYGDANAALTIPSTYNFPPGL